VSAFVGYKLAGIPGAIAAATGTVIPTTVLMLIMIVFFYNIKDSPTVQAMLRAVRPAIVGLLLWTAYDMAYTVWGVKRLGWQNAFYQGWDKGLIMLATFGILTFTKINPVYIVIATALLGFLLYR
ncbi:MAG: chromate transporter, partial [Anaerolineales bacterium]